MKALTQAQWLRESLGWSAGCVAVYYWPGLLASWLINIGLPIQGSYLIMPYWLIGTLGAHGVLWWQVRRGYHAFSHPNLAATGTTVAARLWFGLLCAFQICCVMLLLYVSLIALAFASDDGPWFS